MLRHSFCHIPTVGVKTETRLWEAGVHTWDDLLALEELPVARTKREMLRQHLELSIQHLDAGDAGYFDQSMPGSESWRLYSEFRHNTAYVDIETTGLGPPGDHITTIALYDGKEARWYVRGRNLDDFARDIRDFSLIVTFNGKCFDVPFIEREMGIKLDMGHLDLRFALKAAGVKGGLKKIEKHFGLDRGELDGVDGYFAVLLWKEFQNTRNERVLDTLLAYNIEDVLNLEYLAAKTHNLMVERLPFGRELMLDEPLPGLNPMLPDNELIAMLRQRYGI